MHQRIKIMKTIRTMGFTLHCDIPHLVKLMRSRVYLVTAVAYGIAKKYSVCQNHKLVHLAGVAMLKEIRMPMKTMHRSMPLTVPEQLT